jgi:hypothetical protein
MKIGRDSIALVIAGYAAVVSTAVFVWTVYSYMKDNSDIRLEAKVLVNYHPDLLGGIVQKVYSLNDFHPNSGMSSDWVIRINLANAGKRPATIISWASIRGSVFDNHPEVIFHTPITLQESETEHFFIRDFDVFRHNTKRLVVNDSRGKSWRLPTKQLKQIQKLMLDHKL